MLITVEAKRPEQVEEYFEVMVKCGNSLYFQMLADIQKPRVFINRNVIDLGRIYAGVTETVDVGGKQSLVIKNYGNLPVIFHWEEKIDPDRIIARFEPSRGTIPPKSEIQIFFSCTVFFGGNINELFICEVQDLDLPLGFELHADSFGLSVGYEIAEDALPSMMSLTQTSAKESLKASQMSMGQPPRSTQLKHLNF